MKSSALSLIFGIAIVGFLAVMFLKPKSTTAKTGKGRGPQPPGSTAPSGFPVMANSDPGSILLAFRESGYWQQLDLSQQARAQADPQGWLRDHAYLFSFDPSFFSDGSNQSSSYASPHGY